MQIAGWGKNRGIICIPVALFKNLYALPDNRNIVAEPMYVMRFSGFLQPRHYFRQLLTPVMVGFYSIVRKNIGAEAANNVFPLGLGSLQISIAGFEHNQIGR